jgi:metal-responsive CopG/Arc/MetJ family transcriptional regulator
METQMKEATGKKRVGRSRTGRAPELCITLPKEVLDTIDEIAFEEETTRSVVARDMIVDGIRRRNKITLPKQVLDDIDKIASEEESTRSEIAREMILDGIRRRNKEI